MEFERAMAGLTKQIVQRVRDVYHLTDANAERLLKCSKFYEVLSDSKRCYWKQDAEINFRLLQNEIEYGAWNRNENGGIAE